MSDCPECDKVEAVKDQSQIIGEFLEYLNSKYTLCDSTPNDEFYPVRLSIEELLADYFNINLLKVEQEKRQILESLRQ